MLIERLIDAAIPLWNATLAPLTDKAFYHQRRIDYTEVEYDADRWFLQESEDEDADDRVESRVQWILVNRQLIEPEPQWSFRPRPTLSLDLKAKYGKRGLQVIVTLANIQLTPEKPIYSGGMWHVEGQLVCSFFSLFPPTDTNLIWLERTHCCYSALLLFMREHYDLGSPFQANLSGRGRSP